MATLPQQSYSIIQSETRETIRDAVRRAYEAELESCKRQYKSTIAALKGTIDVLKTQLESERSANSASSRPDYAALMAENAALRKRVTQQSHELDASRKTCQMSEAQFKESVKALQDCSEAHTGEKIKVAEREEKMLAKVREIFRREMQRRNDVIHTQQKALRLLQETTAKQEGELQAVRADLQTRDASAEERARVMVGEHAAATDRLSEAVQEQKATIEALTESNNHYRSLLMKAEESRNQLADMNERVAANAHVFEEQQKLIKRLVGELHESRLDAKSMADIETRLDGMQHDWSIIGSVLEQMPKATLKSMMKKRGRARSRSRHKEGEGAPPAARRSRSVETHRKGARAGETTTKTHRKGDDLDGLSRSQGKAKGRRRSKSPYRQCFLSLPPVLAKEVGMLQKSKKQSAKTSSKTAAGKGTRPKRGGKRGGAGGGEDAACYLVYPMPK